VAAPSTTNTIDADIGGDDSSGDVSDDVPITGDEVICAMANYGTTYKTRNTSILGTRYSFLGY